MSKLDNQCQKLDNYRVTTGVFDYDAERKRTICLKICELPLRIISNLVYWWTATIASLPFLRISMSVE